MRHLLIILIALLTSDLSYGCLSASQNRIFPLGLCSKGLAVVETHLHRTEYFEKERKIEEMKPAWVGKSYFKIYTNNHKVIYSELLDTIKLFEQKLFDSIIGATFKKGLILARKTPGFIAAKPKSIYFCDYQQTCSKGALSFDTIQNKVFIKLPNNYMYQVAVLLDTTSIASNLVNYISGFDDGNMSAKSLNGNLSINSVRQFKLGDKNLTILHLGYGETYPPFKEYKADFNFVDINKSVYNEPVLHHGYGFDFYIME